jgi:transcription initiation factor TFIIB
MLTQNTFDSTNDIMCTVCNGKLVCDLDNGEKFCGRCGIVATNSQEVSVINEINSSTTSSNVTKNGELTSLMLYDFSLPSIIDNKNVDANGNHIHYPDIEKLRRLNKFTISSNPKTKNLNKAVGEIRRITEIIGFNASIAERACYIYRKIFNKGAIRGRSIIGIASATICLACEEMNVPFSIDKIVELAGNSTRKSISHYYKFILRQLKMNIQVIGPSHKVSQIAKKAGLHAKTERKALEILEQVQNDPILSGKKPISLAAAALYLASFQTKEHTTQLRIAIASDLTTITIRKRSMELSQILDNLKSSQINKICVRAKLSTNRYTDNELESPLLMRRK